MSSWRKDELISIPVAYFSDGSFNSFFNFAPNHFTAVFGAKNNMVVNIVGAMVGSIFHDLIISFLFGQFMSWRQFSYAWKNQAPLKTYPTRG